MMNPSQAAGLILQAQLTLEKMYPATVKFSGTDYQGATRGLGVADSLTDQGFVYVFDIVFRIRKTLLPNPPAIGQTVSWNNADYRVKKVPQRPTDCAWYIGCDDPNK